MFALAPELAAMKQRIADGSLHHLDISGELARAAQKIGVALRDRPSAKTVDATLAGRLEQGELGISETLPIENEVLRFLVENRRSRVVIEEGLKTYVDAVYHAGDPKQGGLFGDQAVPDKA